MQNNISNRIFFFGKYKGKPIKEVILEDTQYITWCIEKVSFIQFNEEEMALYNEVLHNLIVARSKAKNYRKKYLNAEN